MATYSFGASGETNVVEGTYGFLQNFQHSYSSDEATAQNAVGDVAAQTIFNEVDEVTCEYVYNTETSLPDVGDAIVVGSTNKFTVMGVEAIESNTEYKRATIKMKRYTAVGIPTN